MQRQGSNMTTTDQQAGAATSSKAANAPTGILSNISNVTVICIIAYSWVLAYNDNDDDGILMICI